MTDYWVATDGSDKAAGSFTAPKRTVQAGVDLLRPGDTLFIRKGRYTPSTSINVYADGAANARIAIQNYDGEVLIDGQLGTSGLNSGAPANGSFGPYASRTGKQFKWTPLLYIRGSYLDVLNLTVANSIGRNVQVGDDTKRLYGVRLQNVKAHKCRNVGLFVTRATGTVISGCTVSEATDLIAGDDWATNHSGGLTFTDCVDTLVVGCFVFNCWGEALMFDTNWGQTKKTRVYGNYIGNNGVMPVYIHATQDVEFVGNYIYKTKDWNPNLVPTIGGAVGVNIKVIENQSYLKGSRSYTSDVLFANNILVGVSLNFGHDPKAPADAKTLRNIRVLHNTFIDPLDEAFNINAGVENSVFANNLVYTTKKPTAGDFASLQRSGNIFTVAPGVMGAGDKIVARGDVAFVNGAVPPTRADIDPNWYAVADSSPIVGYNTRIAGVEADFFETAREPKTNPGAIEQVSEPTPPPVEDPLDVLWQESIEQQVLELNDQAALQRAITADGFTPVSPEFWKTVNGIQYAAQTAESATTGERRVYYTEVPNWDAITWFTKE